MMLWTSGGNDKNEKEEQDDPETGLDSLAAVSPKTETAKKSETTNQKA